MGVQIRLRLGIHILTSDVRYINFFYRKFILLPISAPPFCTVLSRLPQVKFKPIRKIFIHPYTFCVCLRINGIDRGRAAGCKTGYISPKLILLVVLPRTWTCYALEVLGCAVARETPPSLAETWFVTVYSIHTRRFPTSTSLCEKIDSWPIRAFSLRKVRVLGCSLEVANDYVRSLPAEGID